MQPSNFTLAFGNANLNPNYIIYVSSSAIHLPISAYLFCWSKYPAHTLSYFIYKITWCPWGSLSAPRKNFLFPNLLKLRGFLLVRVSLKKYVEIPLSGGEENMLICLRPWTLLNKTTIKYSVNNIKFSVPF